LRGGLHSGGLGLGLGGVRRLGVQRQRAPHQRLPELLERQPAHAVAHLHARRAEEHRRQLRVRERAAAVAVGAGQQREAADEGEPLREGQRLVQRRDVLARPVAPEYRPLVRRGRRGEGGEYAPQARAEGALEPALAQRAQRPPDLRRAAQAQALRQLLLPLEQHEPPPARAQLRLELRQPRQHPRRQQLVQRLVRVEGAPRAADARRDAAALMPLGGGTGGTGGTGPAARHATTAGAGAARARRRLEQHRRRRLRRRRALAEEQLRHGDERALEAAEAELLLRVPRRLRLVDDIDRHER
jgi:hypothetical protein